MNIHLQGFIFVDQYGHIYVADKIYKKSEYKKDNAMLYAIIGVEESLNGKIIPSVFSQKKRLPKMKNKPVEND